MKIIATIAAAALLSATLPVIAQDVTNGQGEIVGAPAIEAGPASGSLGAFTSVHVLAVPDTTGLILDGGPNSGLTKNLKVAEAIQNSGYSGAPILGYDVEGSSLTVYVKAA
jgi:hypothetical protein